MLVPNLATRGAGVMTLRTICAWLIFQISVEFLGAEFIRLVYTGFISTGTATSWIGGGI